ncbi:MAG: hypothetical protein IIC29_08345, partial [Chloroflexi bacterium]|nr:hypothetical protein [Chloroflexota bacterium]
FSFTFGTNVPLLTQSGQIHGTVTLPGEKFEASVVAESVSPGVVGLIFDGGLFLFAPITLVDGQLTFTSGTQGHGTFGATIWAKIDFGGHIVGVADGLRFVMITNDDPIEFVFTGDVVGDSEINISGNWHG